MAGETPSALGSVPYARHFDIYRKPDARGNYPARTEAEELMLKGQVDEWWALVRPTI